jgi:hypothetical protein
MSEANGMWTDKACAYYETTREKSVVLAATPNEGDAASKGYLNYLSFTEGKAKIQIGPIMTDRESVTIHDVPKDIAEGAIQAAIGYVLAWHGLPKV